MRVVIADPPAYTPPYDHALAAALVRDGRRRPAADVAIPLRRRPTGRRVPGRRQPLRARRAARRRACAPAREGPRPSAGARQARAGRLRCRSTCSGWRRRRPTHGSSTRARRSSSPPTTCCPAAPPDAPAPGSGSSAVSTGSSRTASAGGAHSQRSASPPEKLRVIPHPAFRSEPPRRDDGRTVLALGVIRPYKGLPDAVDAVLRVPEARLLVAGDPRDPARRAPLDRRRPRRVAPRLPERARRSRSRSARRRWPSSPTEPSSTSPGPSCRRSEQASRRSCTTSAASARSSAPSAPAASCRPGTSTRSRTPSVSCWTTRRRSPRPAPALREARDVLTWDRAASEHRALYKELV